MNYSFKKYQPLSLRLWHWLNALVILGLLGTVLLRKSFLSWRTNASLIQEKIKTAGGAVEPDVAKSIARSMMENMWDWHYTLGFALGILLIIRILAGLLVKKECPATHALKSALNLPKEQPEKRIHAFHYTAVKTGYALFYLVVLFMVVSGLLMYWKEALHLSRDLADTLKEIHETLQWFFIVFVAGHIGGVIVAELRGDMGLVSDMINGGEKE